jgi:hypothetical protein
MKIVGERLGAFWSARYIKTADSDAAAAMHQFERSLQYAPNMQVAATQKSRLM